MRYQTKSHRHADHVIPAEAGDEWNELTGAITDISDAALIERFNSQRRRGKSISEAINAELKSLLVAKGWHAEAPIFQSDDYLEKRWRLDFAKVKLSVEVAFNHGEATSWNLLKPVLASEFNHVKKAVQTRFGVIICATESLKSAGGFDSAVGTFEKFDRYLIPLQNQLTVPMMLVGLEAPESFVIVADLMDGKKRGRVVPR